jgi:hypothetical protein
MSAGLPQLVPMFSEINIEVRLRPENFGGNSAAGARQRNIFSLGMRFDATSTAHALNITRNKSTLGSTLSNESDTIVIA